MAPMTDMVSVGKRSPSTLMTDSAMTTAAPVRSITNPMMVPNTMTRPMLPRILPKPVPTVSAILGSGMP